MYTFLVPTDFSDTALKAADYAAQMAKTFNGSIELLHVYMLPTTVSEIPYMMETADVLQPEFERRAAKEADRITDKFGISCKWQVQIGLPSAEINFQAEEINAFMIVMGTKGENNKNVFLGSTTIATMKKSSKPILIVPEQADFHSINSILFATDFHPNIPDKSFEPLIQLLQRFAAHLYLLHINKQNADKLEDSDTPAESVNSAPETIAGKMRFVNLFKPFPHEYHEVADDTVVHGILHFEEKQPVDLLVMVAQQHGFFQSLFGNSQTQKMVHKTTQPLLVLSVKE